MEIVKKNKNLGMVIEGGRDTNQKEPRIINIQPGGQAFETAGLRVGQIIKQVDGINLKGKTFHEQYFISFYPVTDGWTSTMVEIQLKNYFNLLKV